MTGYYPRVPWPPGRINSHIYYSYPKKIPSTFLSHLHRVAFLLLLSAVSKPLTLDSLTFQTLHVLPDQNDFESKKSGKQLSDLWSNFQPESKLSILLMILEEKKIPVSLTCLRCSPAPPSDMLHRTRQT